MKTIKQIMLTDDEKREILERLFAQFDPLPQVIFDASGVYLTLSDTCTTFKGKWHDGKGYKKIRFKGRAYYVHRLTYYLAYGDVPSGYVIDHKCRNPGCVNPRHLEAVSVKINTERGNGKWIFNQGYTNDHNSDNKKHDCLG